MAPYTRMGRMDWIAGCHGCLAAGFGGSLEYSEKAPSYIARLRFVVLTDLPQRLTRNASVTKLMRDISEREGMLGLA